VPGLSIVEQFLNHVCFQSYADLRPLYVTIKNIEELNSNILIVINNTRKSYIDSLYDDIVRHVAGKYQIMIIRQSSFMTYLADEGKTPFEIDSLLGVAKLSLETVQEQLASLFNFIRNYESCERKTA
jgi:hypothetical protein